jgi:hypothetical protein
VFELSQSFDILMVGVTYPKDGATSESKVRLGSLDVKALAGLLRQVQGINVGYGALEI